MATIRLMERAYRDAELGKDVVDVSVLEQSPKELARARLLGARVFDVSGCSTRQDAEALLKLSRQEQPDRATDPKGWGAVEDLRMRVSEVTS